jgi:hypothetical protein
MWWWLGPILGIVYLGMAFVSGPVYVWATKDPLKEGDDTFIGYTLAAVTWPLCLPVCLAFTAAMATGALWMKYAQFLENCAKKQKKLKGPIQHREYY